jgi:uncharacterized protein YigE (DUF2233 family)
MAVAAGRAPLARERFTLDDVAPGMAMTTITDATLLDAASPGALSVKALRLDTHHVRVRSVLAGDHLPALERVRDMAARVGALAAINAGFFTTTGAPAGLLVSGGRPVGFGQHPRAAVAIRDDGHAAHLSFGRAVLRSLPAPLAPSRVTFVFWSPDGRNLSSWQAAQDVVGGAGLLVQDGRAVSDFAVERMRDDFPTARHPRSVVGVDGDGAVWLVAVDGRRPGHSVGMSFVELQRLAARLGLRDAVNLDGGGSTTLVVQGEVVNRPTDLTGPRAVSDAIVVLPR